MVKQADCKSVTLRNIVGSNPTAPTSTHSPIGRDTALRRQVFLVRIQVGVPGGLAQLVEATGLSPVK